MNKMIFAAGALMVLTTAVHVFVGGPEVMTPVFASALDPTVRAVLHVVWHGVTVMLAFAAIALLWLSWHSDNTPLMVFVTAVQLGFAALFLAIGIGELGSVWLMPQWVVFLLVPALTLFGWRATR